MHVVRLVAPKAFLRLRQATTCEVLAASVALRAVVVARPPGRCLSQTVFLEKILPSWTWRF